MMRKNCYFGKVFPLARANLLLGLCKMSTQLGNYKKISLTYGILRLAAKCPSSSKRGIKATQSVVADIEFPIKLWACKVVSPEKL